MLYKYKDEYHIEAYNGENIKIYVENVLETLIANPTDDQLKMVGYMELIKAEIPEYDPETQYIVLTYEIRVDKIYEVYTIHEMEENTDEEN